MSFVKRVNKLRQGEYVVTSDYKRGFVMGPASTGCYNVMFLSDTGREWLKQAWPASLLSLSGVEPSEVECVSFAKWMLG